MRWLHRTWQIDAALAGDLSPRHELRFREHLRACDACRREYDAGALLLRLASRHRTGPGEVARIERLAGARLDAEGADFARRRPRAWHVIGAATAMVLLVIGLAAWRRSEAVAVVLARSGEIWIDARPAEPGDRVPPDVLVSAPAGDALLLLDGDRQVLLRRGAAIRIREGGDVAQLAYGRARFDVNSKEGPNPFAVFVEAVRVDVQGTIFVVERRSEGATLVAVHEGQVRVSGAKTQVTLGRGEETQVLDGTPSPARPATDASLAEDRGGVDVFKWLVGEANKVIHTVDRLFRRRK